MGQYRVRLSDWLNVTDKEFETRNSAIEFAVDMLRDIGSAHGLGETDKIEIGVRKGDNYLEVLFKEQSGVDSATIKKLNKQYGLRVEEPSEFDQIGSFYGHLQTVNEHLKTNGVKRSDIISVQQSNHYIHIMYWK